MFSGRRGEGGHSGGVGGFWIRTGGGGEGCKLTDALLVALSFEWSLSGRQRELQEREMRMGLLIVTAALEPGLCFDAQTVFFIFAGLLSCLRHGSMPICLTTPFVSLSEHVSIWAIWFDLDEVNR